MVRRQVITLTVVYDIPWITSQDVAAELTGDLNARGIVVESLLMEEAKDGRQQQVSN